MARKGKSRRYQHKFREIGVDSMDLFSSEMSLHRSVTDVDRRQRYKEKILMTIFDIAEEQLTQRQKDILYCRFVLDMTQVEIGKRLGITQSGVSLQLNGIPNYNYKKKHGGLLPKLRKMCIDEARVAANADDDAEMKRILKLICSRIKKAHPEYEDAVVTEKALRSLSRMGEVSELFALLAKPEIDPDVEIRLLGEDIQQK